MPEVRQVWDLGGTCSGSSSEQVVTSISSGWRAEVKVSGVPQEGQNVRVAWSDDRKLLGWPETIRNDPGFTENQATNGAALVRRQIEQRQAVARIGVSSAS